MAQGLQNAGFSIVATRGTADYLRKQGITVETVNKVTEGRPHIVDRITDMQIDLVINTVSRRGVAKGFLLHPAHDAREGNPLFYHDLGGKGRGPRYFGDQNKTFAGKDHSGVSYEMTQKIPMTKEGYEKLKQELDRILKVERPKNIKDIEEARGHGDLSENAEYHAAKERAGHARRQKA